jgi:G3E family GTPase
VLAFDRPGIGEMERGGPGPVAARVPVTIVTGYLGSGKTTLISELLQQPGMAGTAVIVNELADVGIDQSVIADAGASDVVLLSNGCLCCARGTDLARAVRRLLDVGETGGRRVERVLIETSGAADPGPLVRQVCFDPQLRGALRYGGVLCLFDAAFGAENLGRDPVGYRQLALADLVLLTKTDLVEATELDASMAGLAGLNVMPVIAADRQAALAFLSGESRQSGGVGSPTWLGRASVAPDPQPHAAIGSWSVVAVDAIAWDIAEQAMRRIFDLHGDCVLRTKGIIHTQDDPRPLVVHGVNRHFHRPLRLRSWDGVPATRIVVIGFPQARRAAEDIAEILGGIVATGP